MRTLLALLALSTSLLMAQSPITLSDISDEGSPLSLQGQITLNSGTATLNLVARNHSSKAVLASDVIVSSPVVEFRAQHDHFFKGIDVVEAGGEFPVALNDELPLDANQDIKGITTKGTAKVVWVQFTDGTTWGDANTGKLIAQDRAETIKFMKGLLAVQQQSGDQAFTDTLANFHSSNGAVDALADMLQRMKLNASSLAAILNKRLSIGNTRPKMQ